MLQKIWIGAAALSLAICGPATAQDPPRSPKSKPIILDPKPASSESFTNPDWLKKPTFADLTATIPSKAAQEGRSGVAMIKCWVQLSGLLRSCTVVSEDPPGYGFGTPALLLAPTMLMKPGTRNGQPVESEVSIPLSFKVSGPMNGPGSKTVSILTQAALAKTPTMAEILGALDKKVGDRFAQGKVAYQCSVDRKSGKLNDCVVANISADMTQFQGVARSLISKFQADPEVTSAAKKDLMINLSFGFPDMQSDTWNRRYLTHPQWRRTISPDPGQELFPPEAVKAGLKTGSALVDCVVGLDGALGPCTVISESTPGVGFGAIAQKIAETFATTPWTEDGLPAEGAHVKMPIRLVYQEPAPTPATTPSASPGSPPPSR